MRTGLSCADEKNPRPRARILVLLKSASNLERVLQVDARGTAAQQQARATGTNPDDYLFE
jgi:hypothetical protein